MEKSRLDRNKFGQYLCRSMLVLALVGMQQVNAADFSNSPVVTTATNTATFDDMQNGQNLADYIEDGIRVAVDDTAYAAGNYVGTHYGTAGNSTWVTISRADGGLITAIDFLYGDGFGLWDSGWSNLRWETSVGGSWTGSTLEGEVARGSSVGWTDAAGFTALRVAAYGYNTGYINFGEPQAIALDDLRVGTSAVPVPPALWLFGSGLIGLLGIARRKKAA